MEKGKVPISGREHSMVSGLEGVFCQSSVNPCKHGPFSSGLEPDSLASLPSVALVTSLIVRAVHSFPVLNFFPTVG